MSKRGAVCIDKAGDLLDLKHVFFKVACLYDPEFVESVDAVEKPFCRYSNCCELYQIPFYLYYQGSKSEIYSILKTGRDIFCKRNRTW